MAYPSSIKTFTTKVNATDLVDASHINDLQTEVNSIEEGLITKLQHNLFIDNAQGLVVGHTAQIAFGEVTSEAQVLGTTETDGSLVIGLFSTTDALSPKLKFMKSGNATIGSNTTVADNEELGAIEWYGADGTDLDTLVAEIIANVDDGSVAAGAIGGELLLRTATGAGAMTTVITIDSSQRVGIGPTAPAATLHVDHQTTSDVSLTFGAAAGQIFQNENSELALGLEDSSPFDFYIQGRTSANAARGLTLNPLGGTIAIGTPSAAGHLHVDQLSSSAAIPVLVLDQGDIDDTFINYIGTSAADGSRSISSDTTEDGAKFGAVRVEINGVTKWVRVYDDES